MSIISGLIAGGIMVAFVSFGSQAAEAGIQFN
jgi:hypothetical protein